MVSAYLARQQHRAGGGAICPEEGQGRSEYLSASGFQKGRKSGKRHLVGQELFDRARGCIDSNQFCISAGRCDERPWIEQQLSLTAASAFGPRQSVEDLVCSEEGTVGAEEIDLLGDRSPTLEEQTRPGSLEAIAPAVGFDERLAIGSARFE